MFCLLSKHLRKMTHRIIINPWNVVANLFIYLSVSACLYDKWDIKQKYDRVQMLYYSTCHEKLTRCKTYLSVQKIRKYFNTSKRPIKTTLNHRNLLYQCIRSAINPIVCLHILCRFFS